MSTYSFQASHVINTFNGNLYHMINVRITIDQGKFPLLSLQVFVRVTQGTNTVYSWLTRVSGNQKELNASFTTDAFDAFTGNVDVEFGYGSEIMGVIEDVDINNVIISLDPLFSGTPAAMADNTWLQNTIIT